MFQDTQALRGDGTVCLNHGKSGKISGMLKAEGNVSSVMRH